MRANDKRHGTDPLIPGEEYITYYGRQEIRGTLVDCSSRIDTYMKVEVQDQRGVVSVKHYIINRLHLIPPYRLN